MAVPTKQDFSLYRGDDATITVTYKDSAGTVIDVTGYAAAFQARKNPDSSSAIIDLSSEDSSEIAVGTSDGLFTIYIPASITSTVDTDYLYWDLQVTDTDDEIRTIARGLLNIEKDVTR